MYKDDQKKMKKRKKGDDADLLIQKRVMSGINKGDGIGQMKQKLNDHEHADQDRLREYDTDIRYRHQQGDRIEESKRNVQPLDTENH